MNTDWQKFEPIGWESQKKLSPLQRKLFSKEEIQERNPKIAAVLFLLYRSQNQYFFPLIQRTIYNGPHSNQISLPGGKFETQDVQFSQTALRETEEELGIQLSSQLFFKELTQLYIPPSNFLVYPFFTISDETFTFIPQEKEVSKVFEIPLESLLNTEIHWQIINSMEVPYFLLEDQVVWGATAMILSEVKDIIKSLSLPS